MYREIMSKPVCTWLCENEPARFFGAPIPLPQDLQQVVLVVRPEVQAFAQVKRAAGLQQRRSGKRGFTARQENPLIRRDNSVR